MSKISALSGAVLAATLFLFAGCGGGDDEDIGAICQKGCATAASLKCSGDTNCVANCEKEAAEAFKTFPNCKAQITAVGNCGANRPASDWECGADGASELKENVCSAEQSAAVMCIFGSK
jgi:hypothetical protein